jgi:hypothetical protein
MGFDDDCKQKAESSVNGFEKERLLSGSSIG